MDVYVNNKNYLIMIHIVCSVVFVCVHGFVTKLKRGTLRWGEGSKSGSNFYACMMIADIKMIGHVKLLNYRRNVLIFFYDHMWNATRIASIHNAARVSLQRKSFRAYIKGSLTFFGVLSYNSTITFCWCCDRAI